MRHQIYILLFLALGVISCSYDHSIPDRDPVDPIKGQFLDDWTYEVFMNDDLKTIYRLWIPEGVTPKAILVLTPGNAGDGRPMVNLTEWQDFAKQESIALLGSYVRASSEEGTANLIIAVNEIADARNLGYIKDLHFLLRGHSSGGRFSYDFSTIVPNRTIAYANIKGTLSDHDAVLPPGLFIIGEKDLTARNETIYNAFLKQRSLNGIACVAIEQRGEHGVGDVDNLVRPFLSSVLKKRLSAENKLLELNIEEMELGNNELMEKFSFQDYPYDKKEASCLIDATFNELWSTFVNR